MKSIILLGTEARGVVILVHQLKGFKTPNNYKNRVRFLKANIRTYGTKKKMSKNHVDVSGKNNPNWKNGISKKKYYCKETNCNNEIYYATSRFRQGRCKSCSKKGKLSYNYGKPPKHGLNGVYKGIYMRSSWEIKYAKYLDSKGIKWSYEAKFFELIINKKETTYTPDFYL
ncbi:hypothetical protein LCGC14_1687490, partial [marine sediment metagenome]